jgi:hypothetical protein
MVATENIRRITRGPYDLPRLNTLKKKQTNPNPSRVIDALAQRDQARMLVDGLTAANDLGGDVPARGVASLWPFHQIARLSQNGGSSNAEIS